LALELGFADCGFAAVFAVDESFAVDGGVDELAES
jgi:hypothetical protein